MQGPQSTDRLVATLRVVSSHLHASLRAAFLRVAGPFPLAGPARWSNDWHAYRPCPYPHVHEGLDLMAPRGTPIVAVANATVTQVVVDPVMSGLGVEITDAKGTQYFYAHLERFGPGLRTGLGVRVGQVIGFVGNTGDASGGATHLHFEVQPHGVPVPPKPLVDRWLVEAQSKAERLAHVARGHALGSHYLRADTLRFPPPGAVLEVALPQSATAPPARRQPTPRLAQNVPGPTGLVVAVVLLAPVLLVGLRARRRGRERLRGTLPRKVRASPESGEFAFAGRTEGPGRLERPPPPFSD
jgi:murein DD-endopeptidase MepM/ murein hydrolase activator NlpD